VASRTVARGLLRTLNGGGGNRTAFAAARAPKETGSRPAPPRRRRSAETGASPSPLLPRRAVLPAFRRRLQGGMGARPLRCEDAGSGDRHSRWLVAEALVMLDGLWQGEPAVPSGLEEGGRRRREPWISERADRDRDEFRRCSGRPIHSGPALGAEMERSAFTVIGKAFVCATVAGDARLRAREPRCDSEDASGSPLTLNAVAHRDAAGLAFGFDLQLATAARGLSDRPHSLDPARAQTSAA
jgi:hypothetical protein